MDSHTLKNNIFEELKEYGEECVKRLEEIWRQLFGYDESLFVERHEVIKEHLMALLNEMVKEEEETLEENRRILTDLMKCRQTLQEELSMTIEIPFSVDPMKPNICKQVKKLTAIMQEYETIKVTRLQKLVEYKDTEECLCDMLGEEPRYASISTVPSEELLAEIEARIASLNAEKVRRSDICDKLINEIKELMTSLELDYDDDEVKLAVLNRSDSATFSKSRIAHLEEMKSELDSFKESQIAEIDKLKERTTLLWNLLDVDCAERDHVIRRTVKGFGQSVVNAWTEELERCEALKAVNIRNIISKLRDLIKQLWDECHIGEDERNGFIYFRCENYDDSLLEAHEKEHKRLCDYKNERKSILDLAKKWFTLWEKMIMLENRANSTTNRYANRGGQLLKEERERKTVQKELPKVETTLQKSIAELEEKTGAAFLYDGRPLLEIIAELWEKRRLEKENEKESRKTQNRNTPLKPATTARTPASSVVKRNKVLSAVENLSAKKPVTARRELKMPTSTKKEIRRRSRSHDSKVRHKDDILNEARALSDLSDSIVGSYAGFQAFLNDACKNGVILRSSTSPNSSPATPTCKSNPKIAENSFQFKSPKRVMKYQPTKFFGSPNARRPMLY